RERLVESSPVEVRVEIAQTRRQAAAHLPVRGWVLAEPQCPSAMPQTEQRVELFDELPGSCPAAYRADVDRVSWRGVGRHLQHGERDVQPAAQVQVAVGALELDVPGRPPALDQPVLENQGAELGRGRDVVDDLRALGPPGWGTEVRPSPGTKRYRLADVQRPP